MISNTIFGLAKPGFGMVPTASAKLPGPAAATFSTPHDEFTPQFSGTFSRPRGRLMTLAAVVASALAMVGLSGCGDDDDTSTRTNTTFCAKSIDHDCDGIYDSQDADKDGDGVDNTGDYDVDGDGVSNPLDKWDGFDDQKFDMDKDGIIDAYDTFYGDNSGNEDGDNWVNGFDPQPYTAPPAGQFQTPIPSTVSEEDLTNAILNQQITRNILRDMPDGIPDVDDPLSDPKSIDRDGDGQYDYYDPEPRDGNVGSWNDPWDPRNDEYWEKD